MLWRLGCPTLAVDAAHLEGGWALASLGHSLRRVQRCLMGAQRARRCGTQKVMSTAEPLASSRLGAPSSWASRCSGTRAPGRRRRVWRRWSGCRGLRKLSIVRSHVGRFVWRRLPRPGLLACDFVSTHLLLATNTRNESSNAFVKKMRGG